MDSSVRKWTLHTYMNIQTVILNIHDNSKCKLLYIWYSIIYLFFKVVSLRAFCVLCVSVLKISAQRHREHKVSQRGNMYKKILSLHHL